MFSKSRSTRIAYVALIFILFAASSFAQTVTPATIESPNQDDTINVVTEEVRLQITAVDADGRPDLTIEKEDVSVLEDGVPQIIRDLKIVPANVLLVLDTDTQITLQKTLNTTRDIALEIVKTLNAEDRIAVLQYGRGVELLQDWTQDKDKINHVLETKLWSGKRGRLSEAMMAASEQFKNVKEGTRNIVFITDGIETPGGKIAFTDAARALNQTGASVHIISYTALVGEATKNRSGLFSNGIINLDFEMRGWYKRYGNRTKENERKLETLAATTGGRILLPESLDAMVKQSTRVVDDIKAQYVLNYTPKRPIAKSPAGEFRRVQVIPRRANLKLLARQGYTVTK